MKNSLIKFLVYLLLLLFPLGLLLRIKIFTNVYIVPQDVVVFLLFILILFYYVSKGKLPAQNKIFIGQLGFVSIGLLSLIVNYFLHKDINLTVAFLYAMRYIMYVSLLFLPQVFEGSKKIKFGFYFSGTALLIIGFIQFFFYNNLSNLDYLGWDNHLYRLFATFLDPNFAGVFYAILFIFFISVVVSKNKISQYYKEIIVSFWTMIAVFLTYSRSALLAFGIGIISYSFLKKKYLMIVIIFIALTFFVLIFSDRKIEGLNPFRTVSTNERIQSMGEALSIGEKNIIGGVGFNAFRYAQVRYGFRTKEGIATSNADSGNDNSFLFVFATSGIFGLLFFGFSYYSLCRVLFFEKSQESLLLMCAFIAIFVSSLFLNVLFYTPILTWIFLWFAIRKEIF